MSSKKVDFASATVLKPLKVIIHGAPASGKTEIAKRLARRYGARYISVKTMIDETLDELRKNIETARNELSLKEEIKKKNTVEETIDVEKTNLDEETESLLEEEEANEDDLQRQIDQWKEQILDITHLMDLDENNKLPENYIIRLMRLFLAKEYIQSQGYVLDGFPKTMQQTEAIFGLKIVDIEYAGEDITAEDDEKDTDDSGEEQTLPTTKLEKVTTGVASSNIMPDFVISLQADEEYLLRRVMKLPEKNIRRTRYDETKMLDRMSQFIANTFENARMLNFFNQHQSNLIPIDVAAKVADEPNNENIIQYLFEIFDPPIPGLGLSIEEDELLLKSEMEKKELKAKADEIERLMAEAGAKIINQNNMEKWAEVMEKLNKAEEQILAAENEPLRSYLMKFVFPTLAKGLLEVAQVKPDDPVDYLAEYLFKLNPERKIFDPAYTSYCEELLEETESILNDFESQLKIN